MENEIVTIPEDLEEICEDEAKSTDGYQFQKPEAIKMLFKGSFSKNSKEIIENKLGLSCAKLRTASLLRLLLLVNSKLCKCEK